MADTALANVVDKQAEEIERLRREASVRKDCVCLGLDTMRILMGMKPNRYSRDDIIRILAATAQQ